MSFDYLNHLIQGFSENALAGEPSPEGPQTSLLGTFLDAWPAGGRAPAGWQDLLEPEICRALEHLEAVPTPFIEAEQSFARCLSELKALLELVRQPESSWERAPWLAAWQALSEEWLAWKSWEGQSACPHCRRLNPGGWNHCAHCTTPLPQQEESHLDLRDQSPSLPPDLARWVSSIARWRVDGDPSALLQGAHSLRARYQACSRLLRNQGWEEAATAFDEAEQALAELNPEAPGWESVDRCFRQVCAALHQANQHLAEIRLDLGLSTGQD